MLDLPDVRFSASGLPARVVNAVNMAHLNEESAGERIAEAKAFFGRFGVPFRWLFGVTTTPADLPERLEAAGLGPLSDTPGMGLDIPAMRDEPPDVPGLEVHEVAGRVDLESLARDVPPLLPVRRRDGRRLEIRPRPAGVGRRQRAPQLRRPARRPARRGVGRVLRRGRGRNLERRHDGGRAGQGHRPRDNASPRSATPLPAGIASRSSARRRWGSRCTAASVFPLELSRIEEL